MGQTIAEKILAAHGGLEAVRAGDVVVAAVDFAMLHDARASNALKMISRLGSGKGEVPLPTCCWVRSPKGCLLLLRLPCSW